MVAYRKGRLVNMLYGPREKQGNDRDYEKKKQLQKTGHTQKTEILP